MPAFRSAFSTTLTPIQQFALRPREPTEYRFNFKEPGQEEVGERAVATNSRLRRIAQMPPERKSLAWGALAFAAGLGAV